MLMEDGIFHMGSTKSCQKKSFIINSCQEIHLYAIGAKRSAHTWQLYNCYIQQLYIYIYILGHKEFAYKPIYQSMVLLYIGSTIYNKDSRESLKITKSTVGYLNNYIQTTNLLEVYGQGINFETDNYI